MKRFSMYLSVLAIALVVLASCKKDDDPVGPVDNPKPAPVKNLMAASNGTDAITLSWTASDSAASTLFDGYTITVTSPTVMAPINVQKGVTAYDLTGLQSSIAYTIEVVAKYTNGETSTAQTVTWATANKFLVDYNDVTIKLYSSNVSTQGSGLNFYDATEHAPKVLKVDNLIDWIIGFEDKTDGNWMIGYPDSLDYAFAGHRDIGISALMDANSDDLNMNYADRLDNFMYKMQTHNLYGKTKNQMFFVRIKNDANEYNYAKVIVLYKNGSIRQTDDVGTFIELVLSYQATANLPYAK